MEPAKLDAQPEPAGLYVHVPFCSAVCPYCDFAVTRARAGDHARYITALLAEASLYQDWATQFDTVYLGGGTPSALSQEELSRLLETLRNTLPVEHDARLFFEANPEDVNPAAVSAWRELGVRTLSLGVQSFDDRELRWLGRRHNRADAVAAVETALNAGFDTVSVDLIFGLPGQTSEQLSSSLGVLRDLAPQHVSCYQLTIHEGTPFERFRERGKFSELEEDRQAELYELVTTSLTRFGYDAYEVSNFARGHAAESQHNKKYWRHIPYLGLGPSAHSFDGRARWWNIRDHREYANTTLADQRPQVEQEHLTDADLALETLMLGIRTRAGVDLASFKRRFGTDLRELNRALCEQLVADGYLRDDDSAIAPTAKGMAVADGLAVQFETGI